MKLLITLFIGLFLLTGCDDKGYGTDDITYIPSVTSGEDVSILSTTPATFLAQKAYISVEFSSYMYEGSLNPSNIFLKLDSNNSNIEISVEAYQNKLHIRPLISLIDTETYTLYIYKSIQDVIGNNLDRDYSRTFTCKADFWQSVEAGGLHAMAQSKDGDMYVWGSNEKKQIIDYDDTVIEVNSTISAKNIPLAIINSNATISYSAGDSSSSTIKSDTSLYSVGYLSLLNSDETNLNQISSGTDHTAFVKLDGTLWSWGSNSNGQLGYISLLAQTKPAQEYSKETNWTSVQAGENFSIALKTDGSLWGWGDNTYGQIGDTAKNERLVPNQESSLANDWDKISAGYYHSVGIKIDGSIWSFGKNEDGQLGDASNTANDLPTQEDSNATNWSSVSAGYNHTCAIKTDKTLWCWGSNSHGQLGINDKNSTNIPLQENLNSTKWVSVSAGKEFTLATDSNGSLWSWGYNRYSQLGLDNNISEDILTPTEVK